VAQQLFGGGGDPATGAPQGEMEVSGADWKLDVATNPRRSRLQCSEAEGGGGYTVVDYVQVTNEHFVLKNPIKGPFPAGIKTAVFGTG